MGYRCWYRHLTAHQGIYGSFGLDSHYVAAAFSRSAFQQRLFIQAAAYQGNTYAIEDCGTLWSKLAAFTFFAFTGSSPGNTDAGYFDKFFYAFLRLIWAQQNHIPASVCLIEWHRGLRGRN